MHPIRMGITVMLCLATAVAPSGANPIPDPAAEYAGRAAKLEGLTKAKPWMELADFCEDAGLPLQREEALRKAIALEPELAEAHRRLDELKVGESWLPVAEADAREIQENQGRGLVFYGTKWVSPREAEKWRVTDRRAVRWEPDFRMNTAHLEIYSSRSLTFTRRVARLLENEIPLYRKFYGGIWKMETKPTPFTVFVFKNRETFLERGGPDYCGMIGGSTCGFASSKTGILYVGVPEAMPEGNDCVLSTAVHEMCHGMDHRMFGSITDLPPWMQEGRAEHMCYSILGSQIIPAATLPANGTSRGVDARAALALPLRPFLSLDQNDFYKTDMSLHYAYARSLVHFLFHAEGGRYAPGFRAFLRSYGKMSVSEFEKNVGRISEIEPALKAYMEKTLLPALETRGSP